MERLRTQSGISGYNEIWKFSPSQRIKHEIQKKNLYCALFAVQTENLYM